MSRKNAVCFRMSRLLGIRESRTYLLPRGRVYSKARRGRNQGASPQPKSRAVGFSSPRVDFCRLSVGILLRPLASGDDRGFELVSPADNVCEDTGELDELVTELTDGLHELGKKHDRVAGNSG